MKLSKLSAVIVLFLVLGFFIFKKAANSTYQVQENVYKASDKHIDSAKQFVSSKQKTDFKQVAKKSDSLDLQIQKRVQYEALHLYDFNQDTNSFNDRIKTEAARLSSSELDQLQSISLDESMSQDERLTALYYLKSAGEKAHAQLQNIFFSESSTLNKPASVHSVQLMHQEFELNLRSMALESIEDNIFKSKGQLELNQINQEAHLTNRYLKGLYRLVSLGLKENRPLLSEFINKNLEKGTQL